MLLAIDTSAQLCAACLYDTKNSRVLSSDVRDIGRGHAEILMEQIDNCLGVTGATYSDIGRIGVTNGPGSFTGLRVGLSVARGLRLALKIEAIGISSLAGLETEATQSGFDGKLLTILDARRDQAYCKLSGNDIPFIDTFENLVHTLPNDLEGICGSGSDDLQKLAFAELPIIHAKSVANIETIAELATIAPTNNTPPEPLYLREADAKPQSGFAVSLG
ncbi:MAG: tRNA (adenosine(37)-N6)-threonylcarbamoyltransferase complex dimerization subunit type 1 TsaB [Pseudomonadota bacterium]